MIDRVIDAAGRVADNVWAFSLFVLAAIIAIVAHKGHDNELLHFAGLITATASAVMHGSKHQEKD